MSKTIAACCFAVGLLVTGCGNKDKGGGGEAAKLPPDCEALFAAAEKFVACPKLPPEQQTAYKKTYDDLKKQIVEAKGDEAQKRGAEQCKQALSELSEGAKFRNCPI